MKRRKFYRRLRRLLEDYADSLALERDVARLRDSDWSEAIPLEELDKPAPTWTWWMPMVGTGTFTVRCTCPPNRGDNYAGSCPIHDVQVFS